MKITLVFTVVNIILDPIFIYTLKMGVGGAALATVLAEAISLLIYFWYVVIAKKSYLQIKPREFIYTPQIIKNILKVGIPSTVSQIGISIAVLGVNFILSGFGDLAIAAAGIGLRIDTLAILPVVGLTGGVVPMVGYFRGAKDYPGARHINRLSMKLALGFSIVIGALIFLLAELLPTIFTSDTALIAMAADYLRIVAFAYPFIGITTVVSAAFQGLGKGVPSLVLTMTRAVVIAIPLSYYLAYHTPLGLIGVWVGITVASLLAAILSLAWIEKHFWGLCKRCE